MELMTVIFKIKKMFYEIRIDPLTKEEFTPLRYNQKFACRKNQIDFNNIKARKKREKKAPYDRVIESNRKVLDKIVGKNKDRRIVSKEYLLGAGFNFQFFNRSFKDGEKEYQAIYNYALCNLNNDNYQIIRMK
jgi:hypothetical protein